MSPGVPWVWVALCALSAWSSAAAAASDTPRWSVPARSLEDVHADLDQEPAESEWVPLSAPCATCNPASAAVASLQAQAQVASLLDDDVGLTPPKAPVVTRQIFSPRQPSFFPQEPLAASPSFFPPPGALQSPAPQLQAQIQPQAKQLFGPPPQQQQQQPANNFLHQIGIPENLQQFILNPPKQDFPLPNVQQVLLSQNSGFNQPLLPFSLPNNAPQPPQPPQRPVPQISHTPPPPAPPLQPLFGANNTARPSSVQQVRGPQQQQQQQQQQFQQNQPKEEVQLLYVPVETLRQRGQFNQQRFPAPQQQQQQQFQQQQQQQQFPPQPPPTPQQQQQQQQQQQDEQQAQQSQQQQSRPPLSQSHVQQGQFSLSLNHPTFQQFPQPQPHFPQFQQFQQFPPQPPPPQQQQFREQPFQQAPPPQQQPQPQFHQFSQPQFQQFPPPQFQPHRFAPPPQPQPQHQFSFVQTPTPTQPPTPAPQPQPSTPTPHQPPLSVYMSPSASLHHDTKVTDVLQLLKNARTIPVLDNVSPDSPQVFVGPANLHPPKGYAKFELPYLSSLDTNRVERKVNKLPFFVAPLSFQPPPGYSKILLPPPHIGSVVVNSNVSQQTATAIPQLHEKDTPVTKPPPPPVSSTVPFSLPSAITPVNPRLPTLVNSLDEGRTTRGELPQTTPLTPTFTTPRRPPPTFQKRPQPISTTIEPTTAPPARSTPRRPFPTHPRVETTTEAATVPTPGFQAESSPDFGASAAPDQSDPSFQSQRVTANPAETLAPNGKRNRKRLRNQHRFNANQVDDQAVKSSTERAFVQNDIRDSTAFQQTLSPTTESVPTRFAPENINLQQQNVAFSTERPNFSERPAFNTVFPSERPAFSEAPAFQTDRPSFSDRPAFQTDSPNFSDRPAFQTDRPNFNDRPAFQTDRPNFSDRPAFQTDRPNFSERPAFYTERPNYSDRPAFQTEQPNFSERPAFQTERPFSDRPLFQTERPSFQDVTAAGAGPTTDRALQLHPSSLHGFLQVAQQDQQQLLQHPVSEEPQNLNQIQFQGQQPNFQQEFFPMTLKDGQVQYQYNLQQPPQQQQPQETTEAAPQTQTTSGRLSEYQPTFVRVRGRIQGVQSNRQHQQQQQQQQQKTEAPALLPHVPVELQKAVRVHPTSQVQVQTQGDEYVSFNRVQPHTHTRTRPQPHHQEVHSTQPTPSPDQEAGVSPALSVRVRGKIRSRPRNSQQAAQLKQQELEEQQALQQAEAGAEQANASPAASPVAPQAPAAAPDHFTHLKESFVERSTTSAPLSETVHDVSFASVAHTEASFPATVQQQQSTVEELAVTQQFQEEAQQETTQPTTSTTRGGNRKYNTFVRTGARRPLRPGAAATTEPPTTTTSQPTQRPRATRRPSQLVSVRGRVRRPLTSTEPSTATSETGEPQKADLYPRRRAPAPPRTVPSAISNEVQDSDHQESVPPPRSAVNRFESRRRPATNVESPSPSAPGAPAPAENEQLPAEQPHPQPVRVRVRRPGHRRQPSQTEPTPTATSTGTDQSQSDSKLSYSLDNGEVGKDSQYGDKHAAHVPHSVQDDADLTPPSGVVPALEAHPTFDWSAHTGSSLTNGWQTSGTAGPSPLAPIQYTGLGQPGAGPQQLAPGEVDAKPSQHSDDPADYMDPTPSSARPPFGGISAQDVDNVMKALEEVGLLQDPAASPSPAAPVPAFSPSGPEEFLKEDVHKKAVDPATQKKAGGRRRGNWVRVRVKRPRDGPDGLATAESQNAGSFPGNVLSVTAPTSIDKDAKFEKEAPAPVIADAIDFPDVTTVVAPAPSAPEVVTSVAPAAVEGEGEGEGEGPAPATTPKISSLSISAAEDAPEEEEVTDARIQLQPSAFPEPSAEPTAASETVPSTFAPSSPTSDNLNQADQVDDVDARERVPTTTSTPEPLEEVTAPVTTTASPSPAPPSVSTLQLQKEQEQEQLNKFLGSTTSTKVSMETEICFRGRCIKTKAAKDQKKEVKEPDQVPTE